MNNEQRRIAAQQHFDALPSIEELLQEAEALRPALEDSRADYYPPRADMRRVPLQTVLAICP